MVAARRLLIAGRGGGFSPVAVPSLTTTKEATNPVIEVADNPSESDEQYVPAPIKVGSTFWAYIKGDFEQYAYSSSDGVTFSLANGGTPVIVRGSSGAWDDFYAVEAAVTYDADADVVRAWYKGEDTGISGAAFDIGYATAPGSSPGGGFTKDAGNPILTASAVSTAIGGSVTDLAVSDVVKLGSTVHFFGYLKDGNRYKLWHGTGSGWTSIGNIEIIGTAASDSDVIQNPSVFRIPGSGIPRYGMVYNDGTLARTPTPSRTVRFAHSLDLSNWTYPGTELVGAGSGWEAQRVYAASILKSGYGPDPITDGSSRWLVYYSGSSTSNIDNTGLAYISAS